MVKDKLNDQYISCRLYKETAGMSLSSCSSKVGCIYGDHQTNFSSIPGCKVNGIVDPKNIPEDKREKLMPEDLVTKIEMTHI